MRLNLVTAFKKKIEQIQSDFDKKRFEAEKKERLEQMRVYRKNVDQVTL